MALRVLLADAQSDRAQALAERLEASGGMEVLRAPEGADLAEAAAALAPDVVIVGMGLPDRDGLGGVRALARGAARPIVMFVDRDDPGFMEEAIAAGVSSYTVAGAALPDVPSVVAAAVALFRRHRRVEEELARAKARLEERRTLDRAKAALMRRRGISESQAYRWLRRKAMNESRRIVDVAADLLRDAASGQTSR